MEFETALMHSNTSHVTINLTGCYHTPAAIPYSNTSHVTINHGKPPEHLE